MASKRGQYQKILFKEIGLVSSLALDPNAGYDLTLSSLTVIIFDEFILLYVYLVGPKYR